MTISSEVRKAGPYVGNAVAAAFPFAFKVFAASDLYVVRTDSLGTETVLTLTTDFTVSLNADQNANPGGTVTLPVALASGYTLTIASQMQYLQPTDLTNQGGFYPKVITNALDRLTILVQQLSEAVSRSLKTAISTPSGVNSQLPAPVPYALIGWNSDGSGFQNTDPTYSSALATDLASSSSGKGGALIGFKQTLAGAIARTIFDKCAETVSVKDFGAKGDGVTNDLAAIQACVNAVPAGTTIFFPKGSYFAPRDASDDDAFFVIIEKSGLAFVGEGEGTVLDFGFKVRGSVSAPVDVGATAFGAGDKTIYLAAGLGLAERDWIQLWGVCHPFSTDAGDYQLGGRNPTYNTLYQTRFGEFCQVRALTSPTQIEAMAPVVYPKYQNSTAGLTTTIPGVASAQAVKVAFIEGFRMENLRCTVADNSSFDRYRFRYVKDLVIDNVSFDCRDTEDGRWLRVTSCLNVDVSRCTFNRDITGWTGGSPWNSVIVGGGSMNVQISDCVFENEAQSIDFTTIIEDEFPASFIGDHLTYTNSAIVNCTFRNCSDAGTTHPGGYLVRYQGNTVNGGGGARIRSRNNIVSGNLFSCPVAALSLSAFYDDSLVEGNVFIKPDLDNAALDTADWVGLTVSNFGSECNNNNTPENVVIANNNFINRASTAQSAIQFRHYNNGLPNPTSGYAMTDAEKVAKSSIYVTGNSFTNCYINLGQYQNGIEIRDNLFFGVKYADGYIAHTSKNSGGTYIEGNYFETIGTCITLPSSLDGALTWDAFTIGKNWSRGAFTIGNSTVGTRYANAHTSGDAIHVDRMNFNSGMGISSTRQSGSGTCKIDAFVSDGVSDSSVHLNTDVVTTGDKYVYANGHVRPWADNIFALGASGNRWSVVYAATGTINTSDERQKQQWETDLSPEIRAWAKVQFGKFKFNEAVEQKGTGARWHVGVLAQQIKEAFESEGLDPFAYGILCYDEWDDQWEEVMEQVETESGIESRPTGEMRLIRAAGSSYGVRYEEALALECAYLRSRLA